MRTRPSASIRVRLTAVYGGLFLAVGTLLLVITYGLFARRFVAVPPRVVARPLRRALSAADLRERIADALVRQRAEALDQLVTGAGLALVIGTVLALACGWLMAGRVLRPLRDITAVAQRLSTRNLDERINLNGPRDELKQLADTFDAMLGRLAGAFEAQRRFHANVSHELRTPLTVQRAAVDVALADPEPTVESLRTMAVRVRSAAARQERLIAGLLMLSRSERGIEHYEEVDLAEVAEEELAAVRPQADARDLRISATLRRCVVPGDRMLLERLTANLLENAVLHNVPGGWIDVAAWPGPYGVTLRVANGGPVIAPELAATLFEPFRRSTPDRAGGGEDDGHGLGLSIVAAIAAAHGGRCAARPLPDGGLELVVTIPVEAARAAPGAEIRWRAGYEARKVLECSPLPSRS